MSEKNGQIKKLNDETQSTKNCSAIRDNELNISDYSFNDNEANIISENEINSNLKEKNKK